MESHAPDRWEEERKRGCPCGTWFIFTVLSLFLCIPLSLTPSGNLSLFFLSDLDLLLHHFCHGHCAQWSKLMRGLVGYSVRGGMKCPFNPLPFLSGTNILDTPLAPLYPPSPPPPANPQRSTPCHICTLNMTPFLSECHKQTFIIYEEILLRIS